MDTVWFIIMLTPTYKKVLKVSIDEDTKWVGNLQFHELKNYKNRYKSYSARNTVLRYIKVSIKASLTTQYERQFQERCLYDMIKSLVLQL